MNRQIGVGEFKYESPDTPYLHVTLPSQILDPKLPKNAVTMAMLSCKLPLIFIVASLKLYTEQANLGRGIQI